jgi:hypothetical protein
MNLTKKKLFKMADDMKKRILPIECFIMKTSACDIMIPLYNATATIGRKNLTYLLRPSPMWLKPIEKWPIDLPMIDTKIGSYSLNLKFLPKKNPRGKK